MNPVIFTSRSALAAGQRIIGHFQPAADSYLLRARLRLSAPTLGPATIALQVDGTTQPERFIVGTGVSTLDLPLNVEVAAGALVEWRCLSAEANDAAQATIVMDVAAISSVPAIPLEVWWREATAQLKVFDYDPATHSFTATSLASGRCSHTGTEWALTGGAIADFAAAAATAPGWSESLASGTAARLEFRHGERVLMVLDAGGVHVENLIEATPVDSDTTGFEFYDGLTRAASVDRTGFRAASIVEA